MPAHKWNKLDNIPLRNIQEVKLIIAVNRKCCKDGSKDIDQQETTNLQDQWPHYNTSGLSLTNGITSNKQCKTAELGKIPTDKYQTLVHSSTWSARRRKIITK